MKPNSTRSIPSAAGVDRLARRQPQRRSVVVAGRHQRHRDGEVGVGHRQPGQLGGHRLRQSLGGLGPGLGQLQADGRDLLAQLVDAARQPGQRLLGDVELSQPLPRLGRPPQHPVDVGGVLAGEAAQLGLTGQLGLQRAGVGGQLAQEVAELAGGVADDGQDIGQLAGQGGQHRVVGGLQQCDGPADGVDGRLRPAFGNLVHRRRQRGAGTGGGLAQRVEFGQPADVGHQRLVLARRGVDTVDLGQRELQPVGLLRQLAGAVGPVDQIAPGHLPLVAHLLVALEFGLHRREAVERGALLVGAHQPQLVVLAVQGQQPGGERGQRPGRHAAPTEVGPRRAVAAHRAQRDDGAVVIAVGARGVQDLVDLRRGGRVEFVGGEPAFDDGARRSPSAPGWRRRAPRRAGAAR